LRRAEGAPGGRRRLEPGGRRLTQDLALAVQASLLARHAPSFVSEAFCASRLQSDLGGVFGTLAPGTPFDALIERAMPAAAPSRLG
jgi:putative acyl-CoA dehydrogenase